MKKGSTLELLGDGQTSENILTSSDVKQQVHLHACLLRIHSPGDSKKDLGLFNTFLKIYNLEAAVIRLDCKKCTINTINLGKRARYDLT